MARGIRGPEGRTGWLFTAPAVLTEPLTARMQYRRAPDRVFTDFDTCVETDRSLDRTTGLDRFDKTPPADLPPPPTE